LIGEKFEGLNVTESFISKKVQQQNPSSEMIEEVFSYENLFIVVKELQSKNRELEKKIDDILQSKCKGCK
jgi:translation initiation factor 2 beta subunit (eIF-2beta)/eIF-5